MISFVKIFIDDEDRRFNVIRNEDTKKVSQLEIYRGLEHLEPDIELFTIDKGDLF